MKYKEIINNQNYERIKYCGEYLIALRPNFDADIFTFKKFLGFKYDFKLVYIFKKGDNSVENFDDVEKINQYISYVWFCTGEVLNSLNNRNFKIIHQHYPLRLENVYGSLIEFEMDCFYPKTIRITLDHSDMLLHDYMDKTDYDYAINHNDFSKIIEAAFNISVQQHIKYEKIDEYKKYHGFEK